MGSQGLYTNTSGNYNIAIGTNALFTSSTGSRDIAIGDSAMFFYVGTGNNTAVGGGALAYCTTGNLNTAMGIGSNSFVTTGNQNTAIGTYSGPTSNVSNQSALGYLAGNGTANCVVLGNNAVTTLNCNVALTVTSDRRVKNNVEPENHGLDFIMRLRPVTYNYDVRKADQLTGADKKIEQLDPEARKQYDNAAAAKEKIRYTGFIAQEVESAANTIGYDFSGVSKPSGPNSIYGLAYSDFVVPLVKSVQEQQTMIEAQKALIEKMNTRMEQMQHELDELKKKE